MKYSDLTIHQRISLKGLFTSPKERRDIGLTDTKAYECLRAIMVLWNFKIAIEYFLTGTLYYLAYKNGWRPKKKSKKPLKKKK